MAVTDRRRVVRANRLDERHAVILGVISGIVAAVANVDPTGHQTAGRVLTRRRCSDSISSTIDHGS
jgi:hypothetical protein